VTEERPAREGDEVANEGLGRLLALADGVFAIALTLLVIEITLPEGTSDARLGAALVALGPRYFAYVLSFAVIARFWIAHHHVFRYLRGYDDTLLWLNFLPLMLVAFLPFPTSVLGAHGNTPTGATFYGAALVCTSAASRGSLVVRLGTGPPAATQGGPPAGAPEPDQQPGRHRLLHRHPPGRAPGALCGHGPCGCCGSPWSGCW
jgi:Endosomal/lysosomal potassium channel TMEM175